MSNHPQDWTRFTQIPAKICARGSGWLRNRLVEEYRKPTTSLGRTILPFNRFLNTVFSFPARIMSNAASSKSKTADTVFAFLDMDVCPITFDVIDFILLATLDQRRLGLNGVHVVIVPGTDDGFKKEEPIFAAVYDHPSRHWRLQNIIVPALGLMPNVTGYTMCSNRAQAQQLLDGAKHISPAGYSVTFPVLPKRRDLVNRAQGGEALLPFLKAPIQANRYVKQWIKHIADERRLICITLRNSSFGPERNSNLEAWLGFARNLDPAIYQPVIIQDTEVALSDNVINIEGIPVFREGAWNILLRAAMYEQAWLVTGTVGGPTELCWYNHQCRYVFLFPPKSISDERRELMVSLGFTIGKSFEFATANQKIVWEEDTEENISKAFESFVTHPKEIPSSSAPKGPNI